MTTLSHSNFNLHRLLTDQGACVHTHYPESFEDVGDAESGPDLIGGPAYDEYACDSHTFIVDNTGCIVFTASIDWDFERFMEGMSGTPEGIMEDPRDLYVRKQRAGENYAVRYRDEDGAWFAQHDGGWCDDQDAAHSFHREQAEQIAHAFNMRGHDRIVGRAIVINYATKRSTGK